MFRRAPGGGCGGGGNKTGVTPLSGDCIGVEVDVDADGDAVEVVIVQFCWWDHFDGEGGGGCNGSIED